MCKPRKYGQNMSFNSHLLFMKSVVVVGSLRKSVYKQRIQTVQIDTWVEESILYLVETCEEKFIENHFWRVQKLNSSWLFISGGSSVVYFLKIQAHSGAPMWGSWLKDLTLGFSLAHDLRIMKSTSELAPCSARNLLKTLSFYPSTSPLLKYISKSFFKKLERVKCLLIYQTYFQ